MMLLKKYSPIDESEFKNINPHLFPEETGYDSAIVTVRPLVGYGAENDGYGFTADDIAQRWVEIGVCNTTTKEFREKIFKFVQNQFKGEKVVIKASVNNHPKNRFTPLNSEGKNYEDIRKLENEKHASFSFEMSVS